MFICYEYFMKVFKMGTSLAVQNPGSLLFVAVVVIILLIHKFCITLRN